MRSWTKRDWALALVLIVGGLVGARLFPSFWDSVVIPIAAVGFLGTMAWQVIRRDRQAKRPGPP